MDITVTMAHFCNRIIEAILTAIQLTISLSKEILILIRAKKALDILKPAIYKISGKYEGLMQTEIYKGCKIISTPHKLVDAGGFNYSVNGIIQIELSSQVTDIMIENLKIPDKDWKHVSEDGADEVFIKHAKIYIENNVT